MKNLPSIIIIYFCGLLQGISFTTIPGASSFLTSKDGFSLTAAQYGALFIPMFLGALTFSFIGGFVAKRFNLKILALAGNVLGALALSLFFYTSFGTQSPFIILLFAMLALGAGFGSNLTCFNVYIVHFFPNKPSIALTALHTLLGIGTAIGPLLFNFFYQRSSWFWDPLFLTLCFLLVVILFAIFLHSPPKKSKHPHSSSSQSYTVFVLFLLIALVYGYIETIFGNWGLIYLKDEKNLSATVSSLALSVFWLFVTIGRVAIAIISTWVLPQITFRLFAPIILIGLILFHFSHSETYSLFSFSIAGLGCSAFLPFSISLSEKAYLSMAEIVSGCMMATYMLGYGIASFATGLFIDYMHVNLTQIFNWLILSVCILGILTFWGSSKISHFGKGNIPK